MAAELKQREFVECRTPEGRVLVLLQDRCWGNGVSYFACDIPQYLSGS